MIINRGPTESEVLAYIREHHYQGWIEPWLLSQIKPERVHRCSLKFAERFLKSFQFHTYGVLSLTQEGRTVRQAPQAVDRSVTVLKWIQDPWGETFRRVARAKGRTRHRRAGNELDLGRQLERLRLLQDGLFGLVADACEPCSFQLINGRAERGARFKASVRRLHDYRLRAEVERCVALKKLVGRFAWWLDYHHGK